MRFWGGLKKNFVCRHFLPRSTKYTFFQASCLVMPVCFSIFFFFFNHRYTRWKLYSNKNYTPTQKTIFFLFLLRTHSMYTIYTTHDETTLSFSFSCFLHKILFMHIPYPTNIPYHGFLSCHHQRRADEIPFRSIKESRVTNKKLKNTKRFSLLSLKLNVHSDFLYVYINVVVVVVVVCFCF